MRRIICAAYLIATAKSDVIGATSWPDETVRPYDLIYFFTRPEFLNVPIADMSNYFGEIYQGLRRVSGSERILKDYGSLSNFAHKVLKCRSLKPLLHKEFNDSSKQGQGYERDSRVRRAIEVRSLELAKLVYENNGYHVSLTGTIAPYDLRGKKNGEEVRVEVKGTRSEGKVVIVTRGEVNHARRRPCRVDLMVVSNIIIQQTFPGQIAAIGGEISCHAKDWEPAESDLTLNTFDYRIPVDRQEGNLTKNNSDLPYP